MVESFGKPGRRFLARWPSAAATQAARRRIRELTGRRLLRVPVEDVVANLNRFLSGWGGYFRRGNSTTQFHKLDRYAVERLGRFVGQRHGLQGSHSPMAAGSFASRATSACARSSDASTTAPRTRPGEGCRCAV